LVALTNFVSSDPPKAPKTQSPACLVRVGKIAAFLVDEPHAPRENWAESAPSQYRITAIIIT
jgi:hypothetical protein